MLEGLPHVAVIEVPEVLTRAFADGVAARLAALAAGCAADPTAGSPSVTTPVTTDAAAGQGGEAPARRHAEAPGASGPGRPATADAARAPNLHGVRAVAFVGASADVFSLGMDLETFVRQRQDPREAVEAIGRALVAIHRCPLPTLGVARGRVVGGGVGLLAACDYVLAEAGASFGLPELLWGFVPPPSGRWWWRAWAARAPGPGR